MDCGPALEVVLRALSTKRILRGTGALLERKAEEKLASEEVQIPPQGSEKELASSGQKPALSLHTQEEIRRRLLVKKVLQDS